MGLDTFIQKNGEDVAWFHKAPDLHESFVTLKGEAPESGLTYQDVNSVLFVVKKIIAQEGEGYDRFEEEWGGIGKTRDQLQHVIDTWDPKATYVYVVSR